MKPRGASFLLAAVGVLAGLGVIFWPRPSLLPPPKPPMPPVPSPLAMWPWTQAVQDTPHLGVTHWLDTSSPDGTMLDFFDFDLGKNPHLHFELYDQD